MQSDTAYFFDQPGLFIIPVEYLCDTGVTDEFRQALLDNDAMTSASVELFNRSWQKYQQRSSLLFKADPANHFPPRCQHIGIVTDPDQVRPFAQPFHNNSWLLYRDDFIPETSSIEFATYLFLHAERTWLTQSTDMAWRANLTYLLILKPEQQADFINGCQSTTRPDHNAFIALADALPNLNGIHHRLFKPPANAQISEHQYTGDHLAIPAEVSDLLSNIQETWSAVNHKCLAGFFAQHTDHKDGHASSVLEWLRTHQPDLIITGDDETIIWSPAELDPQLNTGALQQQLQHAGKNVIDSILADIETITTITSQFHAVLKQPEQLAKPASYMQPGGLCYIHPDHAMMTYSLCRKHHPERLRMAAQPYTRLMLQARAAHEWGHLAAESGWVGVPEQLQTERINITQRLTTLLDNIVTSRDIQLPDQPTGKQLLKRLLIRIEDYQANLVAKQLLPVDAMDTYVRNNVHAHWQEYSDQGQYMLLLRYAYEFQYLYLSSIRNPLQWFLSSTWFSDYYLQRNIITADQFEHLLELTRALCSHFRIASHQLDF